MAEGGEGEDEIQFLRTVSRLAASQLLTGYIWLSHPLLLFLLFPPLSRLHVCGAQITTAACLFHHLACLTDVIPCPVQPSGNPVPSPEHLGGGGAAPLFCASPADSYCLPHASLSGS